MPSAKTLWRLTKETFDEWNEDKAPRLAAALSYYSLFSLAPVLLIVIAVAGMVFGREAAQGQLVAQIEGLLGHEGATAVQALIEKAWSTGTNWVATVVGVVTLLIGATGVFAQLQDALNLTDDQRKQLADLQKEVDGKLAKILTDEQKEKVKAFQSKIDDFVNGIIDRVGERLGSE